MLRLLKRITADVLAGKHIETYVVTVVALGVAVLSIVEDVVPLDLQMAAILAALALLVFKTSSPEGTPLDLDSVLLDRQSYRPLREFIKGGDVLWVYGPSAVNLLTNSGDLEKEILKRGGEIRVLLQDPEETASLKILNHQLDEMSYLLTDDIKRSIAILETLKKRCDKLDYRFLPYSPGFSTVIIDPDGRDGRLIIEFFGYANQAIGDRMHIEIHRKQTAYWFEYWTKQFNVMWEDAREPEKT